MNSAKCLFKLLLKLFKILSKSKSIHRKVYLKLFKDKLILK